MRLADGSVSDARLRDPGIRALLAVPAKRQRYLDVEAALALAQAECGVIPRAAADAIAARAHLDDLDADALTAQAARTGHVMVPIVRELAAAVGSEHGGWVHWGATTQNIQQTADVLGIRQALHTITDLLVDVLAALADLGQRTAATVMAGRTHGQQAVPITFGHKVAAWTDALLRHRERLDQLGARLFIAMAAGAAGTFAAMGPDGPAVQQAFARRLGLREMAVPSRTIADPFAELVCTLALLSTSGSAIAEEITRLASTEVGEVAETLPPGDVGSSTMPQKRNPKLCQEIIALGAQCRALTPLALEAVIQAHEADGSRTAMMDEAVEQALVLSADALVRLGEVIGGVQVFAERMRANLDRSGGAIMAESVMMALAATMGRQRAHDVVHAAAATAADSGRAFADVLAADPAVTSALDAAQVAGLLDPAAHVGQSERIARDAAARAHAAVATHRRGP